MNKVTGDLAMIYAGKAVQLTLDDQGIAELVFDARDQAVNVLNKFTLHELQDAIENLKAEPGVQGLLLRSAKAAFIVGADITEFNQSFQLDDAAFKAWLRQTHQLFREIENLPYPTVTAINGMALGGGFELSLCSDYRVLGDDARVGLPEVNLGIYPGWGGTVRLPRLIGLANGLDWVLGGEPQKAKAALAAGAVDQIASSDSLYDSARTLLDEAVSKGREGYLRKRQEKRKALTLGAGDQEILDEARNQFNKRFGSQYPAPGVIVDLLAGHAELEFDAALELETETFPALAKGSVAKSLIGLFLNDQLLKRKAKLAVSQARPVNKAAVLGAGIMGGGVAYQSAITGTSILMKDISGEALELGLREAEKLLSKRVEKGRLAQEKKEVIFNQIEATLDYEKFSEVDLVVEAVVENPQVKAAVLSELEQKVSEGAVLTSNTSSISITHLAKSLKAPENFCGMHFFNPVHAMPLVEVIRGEKSSDEAVATTVAYAASMGKTPIVVNDCPGFLVNRILFTYFNAFNRLLKDGVDFQRIDRVMEKFGWPMGPAYLADVCGLDTLVHADAVMVQGFPERMSHDGETVMEAMLASERLGQKNGRGFYRYGVDENGRRIKDADPEVYQLIRSMQGEARAVSDEEIVERMMIPLCLEAVLCLEDGIADSAAEVDMGLILGLGFPRFRGGPLRFIDHLGLRAFADQVNQHAAVGPLYRLTDSFQQRVQENRPFFD